MAKNLTTAVSSKTQTVEINRSKPTVIIGERINPTGRKKVLKALQAGDFDMVREDATSQVAAGAEILDVNAGVPGADEPALLKQVMGTVLEVADVPLCIDTADPEALEAALSIYEGKALVNSVNGEERALEAVLPLVKEYGAAVIGLCMDDDGIPETPEARLSVASKIIERAGSLGIPTEDVVIDPLALTMGADSSAGRTAAEVEGRKAVLRLFRFVRKQPGLEGFCIDSMCNEAGIRETATIVGKETIATADYEAGRQYDDAQSA